VFKNVGIEHSVVKRVAETEHMDDVVPIVENKLWIHGGDQGWAYF